MSAPVVAPADLCRVVEVFAPAPPPPGDPDRAGNDPDRPRRHAAVVSAYHLGVHAPAPPLVFGWCRTAQGGPVTVLTTASTAPAAPVPRPRDAAPAPRGAAAGQAVPLNFPPGSRGEPCPAADVAGLLGALPAWTELRGVVDGLLVDQRAPDPMARRPDLADGLLGAWHRPFAWLLVAVPVPPAGIRREADRVAAAERDARGRASSPEHAVRAARLEHRHRELRAAEATGMWRVRLFAGGPDPAAATAVAGLLCAGADLTGLPYAFAPDPALVDPAGLFAPAADGPEGDPLLASSLLVAALARPPAVEVPGLRVVPRPTFDVTPEVADPGGIDIGEILDRDGAPAGRLRLPGASLNRHTFVCGATGAGKSQTIRHLLDGATAAGLPWLVVEPAKAEYRSMAARLGPGLVVAVRPGDPDTPPVGLNPLEPAAGFPLQTHLDLVRALFLAAFETDEPFPQVLAAALHRCYTEQGWDLPLGVARTAGRRPRHPTLADLQRAAEQVVSEIGYGPEISDNVRGFVRVRLASLRLGTTGRFFEGGHPLDLDRLLAARVVFEIEDVGDDRDKAFLMGALLVRLVEHLRVVQRRDPGLARRTTAPERLRGGAPAAAPYRATGAGRSRRRTVRRAARRDPRVRRGPGHRRTDPGQARARRHQEHRGQDHAQAAGPRRPGRGRRHRQPDRGAVGPPGHPAARDRCGLHRRDGPPAARDRPRRHPPGGRRGPHRAGRRAGRPAQRHVRPRLPRPPLRPTPDAARRAPPRRRAAARRVWAELAVLGHLTGWGSPMPDRDLIDGIEALPERLRHCALSHAVDRAVAARTPVLACTPDDLAAHVLATLPGLPGRTVRCADEESGWLAPPYRWALVLDELTEAVRADPAAPAHPRTAEWNATYRARIPDVGRAEQLAHVRDRFAADQRDAERCRTAVFGRDDPSALVTAVGARPTDPDWNDRVEAALRRFLRCTWPARYLGAAA
ncbi:helicase HerA domain-containing protein [Polymorphospora rubra]|uniref:helicase HerA domain-containing protein n=1 Tax=Polymorphospora rubra TaxID=338584 RepID=UPI0033CD9347